MGKNTLKGWKESARSGKSGWDASRDWKKAW